MIDMRSKQEVTDRINTLTREISGYKEELYLAIPGRKNIYKINDLAKKIVGRYHEVKTLSWVTEEDMARYVKDSERELDESNEVDTND